MIADTADIGKAKNFNHKGHEGTQRIAGIAANADIADIGNNQKIEIEKRAAEERLLLLCSIKDARRR